MIEVVVMIMMMIRMKMHSPTCIKTADIKLVKSRVIKNIDKHCRRTIERITSEKQTASPHFRLQAVLSFSCFFFLILDFVRLHKFLKETVKCLIQIFMSTSCFPLKIGRFGTYDGKRFGNMQCRPF